MRHLLLAVFVLAVPRAVLACPVCFGQNDSPMANAINAGVIVMLGFVVAVLAGFGSFIFYLSRRARLAEEPAAPTETGPGAFAPPRYARSNPQEGTAPW
jgi:hypothetical protein